jgi:hypothetical protein
MPVVNNYQRGVLNNIAKAQISRKVETPGLGLQVGEAEDLSPQPLQVVLLAHTTDHLQPLRLPVETLEDMEETTQRVALEDFPVLNWMGDPVAAY